MNSLICDSKYSTYYNDSYIFQLDKNYSVSEAIINNIYIPNSCYMINKYNQNFEFIYNDQLYTITIPIGDYSDMIEILDFIDEEIKKLNLDVNFTFDFSYNNYKITIKTDKDVTLKLNKYLSYVFGFKHGVLIGKKFISDSIINLSKTSYYKLRFKEFDNEIILINHANLHEYLYSDQPFNMKIPNKLINLNQLTVKIFDEFDNIVNLNGVNFYFKIDIIYND